MGHFKPFFYLDRTTVNGATWSRIFVEPNRDTGGVHIEMISASDSGNDHAVSVNMSLEKFRDFIECCVNAELQLSGELDDWVGEPI